ncbi:MAG: lipocalin family protein [Pseudomonadota bacterium]
MKSKYIVIAALPLLLQYSCGSGSRPASKAPQDLNVSPSGLTGEWSNQSLGLTVTFDEKGVFTWKQGKILEEGNYSISSATLHMTVMSGKTTPYTVLELTETRLTLEDPRGAVAYLERAAQTAPAAGDIALDPPVVSMPAPLFDMQHLVGTWNGPYGIVLQFTKDGHFIWDQPDFHMEGDFSIAGDALNLTVQGNPTPYRILHLSGVKMLIVDAEGNEIALAKKIVKIIAYTEPEPGSTPPPPAPPPIAVKIERKLRDEKSIFSVNIPDGWKASEPKSCKFPCLKPDILVDAAGRKMTVAMDTFVTTAGTGAFNRLVGNLDKMMGPFSKDREKLVDAIDTMNGMEVFSRRFTGSTANGSMQMISRIIGVHYDDYLVLGAVVLTTKSKFTMALNPVMDHVIDSMNFDFNPDARIQQDLGGAWVGSSKDASILSMNSKHLFVFYPGGNFVHAPASDKFAPGSDSINALLDDSSARKGKYRVVQKAIFLDYEGAEEEEGESSKAYAIKIDGKNLFLDSMTLKKVDF